MFTSIAVGCIEHTLRVAFYFRSNGRTVKALPNVIVTSLKLLCCGKHKSIVYVVFQCSLSACLYVMIGRTAVLIEWRGRSFVYILQLAMSIEAVVAILICHFGIDFQLCFLGNEVFPDTFEFNSSTFVYLLLVRTFSVYDVPIDSISVPCA